MDEPGGPTLLSAYPEPGRSGGIHVGGSLAGAALITGSHNVVTIVYNGTQAPSSKQLRHVRVFVSSALDVAYERQLIRQVVEELIAEPFLRDRVTLTIASWDNPAAPMPKPSECDIVVVILWSRFGTPLPETYRKPDGTLYHSATELEFEDAMNALPRPQILVYRRTEEPKIGLRDPDFAEKLRQYSLVEQFFARFRDTNGSLQGGFAEYNSPSDFADRCKKDLRERVAATLDRVPGPPQADPRISSAPVVVVRSWVGSPYPGLRPLTFDEAAIFFGRGREVDDLIARLGDSARHFLAVVGSSGSGKSSLVRAGLLPRIAGGAIEGSQHWPVLVFTPGATGDDPFLALAVELSRALAPAHAQKPAALAKALAEAPQSLTEHATTLLAGLPTGSALVLFVDQLEELFTTVAERHQGAFASLLVQAAEDARLRVLVTLRADFLPQSMSFLPEGMDKPVFAPLLQAGIYLMSAPGPAALVDIIRRPADRAGLELQDGVADEILRNVGGGDPGDALPLVAFCLEELYRRTAPDHRLTLDAYHNMGGLRGTIGRRAAALLEEFGNPEALDLEAALSQLFRALIYIDATGKAARQRASWDELMSAPPPIPGLIEALINGRLLVAEKAEDSVSATVTLAHEVLIQEWPALSAWVGAHRAEMQRVRRLLLNLEADELSDRLYAIGALGDMGPAAVEAVPKLIAAVNDVSLCSSAARALGEIGRAAEAVPALKAHLSAQLGEDGRVGFAITVIEALGSIGPAAASAARDIEYAANHYFGLETGIEFAANEAMKKIGAKWSSY
jgi:hypothetical protein